MYEHRLRPEMAGAAEQTPLLKQRVRIDGLSARPDLNGQFGKAVKFVSESGRSTWSTWSAECSLVYPGRFANKLGKNARTEGSGSTRSEDG